MPKKLIADIYTGYIESSFIDPTETPAPQENPDEQPADAIADPAAEAAV
jgi:hypothetical protein